MKKILCLVMVLVLAISVSSTAFAADIADLGNSEELSKLFDELAVFLRFDGIMQYVNEFHVYMADFYEELDVFLQSFGVVINGILTGLFASGSFPL